MNACGFNTKQLLVFQTKTFSRACVILLWKEVYRVVLNELSSTLIKCVCFTLIRSRTKEFLNISNIIICTIPFCGFFQLCNRYEACIEDAHTVISRRLEEFPGSSRSRWLTIICMFHVNIVSFFQPTASDNRLHHKKQSLEWEKQVGNGQSMMN